MKHVIMFALADVWFIPMAVANNVVFIWPLFVSLKFSSLTETMCTTYLIVQSENGKNRREKESILHRAPVKKQIANTYSFE